MTLRKDVSDVGHHICPGGVCCPNVIGYVEFQFSKKGCVVLSSNKTALSDSNLRTFASLVLALSRASFNLCDFM